MKMHCYGMASSGQWVPLQVDPQGSLSVSSPNNWVYTAASGGIVDTSDVELVAAAGLGQSNYLKTLQFINKDAAAGTEVVIKDGSTVIWRGYAPAVMITQSNIVFDPPLASSQNAALNVAAITTSAELYVNAQGYTDLSLGYRQHQLSLPEEIYDDYGVLVTGPTGDTTTLYLN